MPIWKLQPVDMRNRHWQYSSYSQPAVVRAPNEERARYIASLAFVHGASKAIGDEVPRSVWNDHSVVSANQLTTSEYEEQGQDEILCPREYNRD